MAITLRGYLDNPMGKGVPIAGDQTSIKNSYNERLEHIHSKMSVKWYELKDRSLIAHVKIPSSTAVNEKETLYYDVILEFDISVLENRVTLNDLPMTVFSNCPSFVFTYANVFHRRGHLCEWSTRKYDHQVIRHSPSERNTYELIGYEKSLYLACLFLTKYDTTLVSHIKNRAIEQVNYIEIMKNIRSQEEILSDYQRITHSDRTDKSKFTGVKHHSSFGSKVSSLIHPTGLKKTSHTKSTKKAVRTKHTKKV